MTLRNNRNMDALMETDNSVSQAKSVELAREKKKNLEALLTQLKMTTTGHRGSHKCHEVENHVGKETAAAIVDELDPTYQEKNQLIEDIKSLDSKSFDEFESTINAEFSFNDELFNIGGWIRNLPMQFKNDEVVHNGMKTLEIRVGQRKDMLEARNAKVEEQSDIIEKFKGSNAVTITFMKNAKLLRGKSS